MNGETCPTCGAPVRVLTGAEGTSAYVPTSDAEIIRETIDEFVVGWKSVKARPDALAALARMGAREAELRQERSWYETKLNTLQAEQERDEAELSGVQFYGENGKLLVSLRAKVERYETAEEPLLVCDNPDCCTHPSGGHH